MIESTFPTALALTLNDLVFYLLAFVFLVGPGIAKILKKIPQTPGPSPRRPEANTANPHRPTVGRTEAAKDLTHPTRPPSPEPVNLTMTQRRQRSAAKAAYQQRAKRLQQSYGARVGPVASPPVTDDRQHPTDQVGTTKKGPQYPPAATPPVVPGHRSSLAPLGTEPSQHTESIVSHRLTADPDNLTDPSGTLTTARDQAHSMRRAVVLKEILDPPIALRAPSVGP